MLAVMIGVVVALLLALAWFYLSSRNRPVMRASENGASRLQESAAPVVAAVPPAYTGVMMPPTA